MSLPDDVEDIYVLVDVPPFHQTNSLHWVDSVSVSDIDSPNPLVAMHARKPPDPQEEEEEEGEAVHSAGSFFFVGQWEPYPATGIVYSLVEGQPPPVAPMPDADGDTPMESPEEGLGVKFECLVRKVIRCREVVPGRVTEEVVDDDVQMRDGGVGDSDEVVAVPRPARVDQRQVDQDGDVVIVDADQEVIDLS